jgi:two-component system chemotaxis response regulator CheB
MIRCLVADDSRAFRAILRTILARAPEVEVVGEAADGAEAVSKVLSLRPDVVTMDVRMPGKDGLVAIDEIMRIAPTPIVVISAEAGPERQEIAFRALDLGAIEVLAKPRSDGAGRFEREAEAIRLAVRSVAGLKLVTRHRRPFRAAATPAPAAAARPRPAAPPPLAAAAPPVRGAGAAARVLGIAASTGGPAGLARILKALPREFPLPVLVVQHIAQGFEAGLVHWLSAESALPVKLADEGEPLRPGAVLFAPEGRHLVLSGGMVRFTDAPPVGGFRPSGTVLLSSLARELGPAAAGLVLSGMGEDGAAGLAEIRARGGWTAAQGPGTSVVFGMPRAAIERGAAALTLELDDVAPALVRLAAHRGPEAA